MTTKKRVGILISGRGTNMQALIDACQDVSYPAEIVSVISNRPDAPGLGRARDAGIATVTVDHTKYETREPFERALHQALLDDKIELICCAGWMRLLTSAFVDRWRNRQLNIHPSLLPAFKGLNTHQRVIEAGAKISGCTVHFVREEMDAGPIVAQGAVPISPRDTPETLANRILQVEHKIYPHALRLVASGAVRVVGESVIHTNAPSNIAQSLFSPPLQPVSHETD